MSREQIALRLIERIYQAAFDPPLWERFVSELSDVYGGATVNLALQWPGASTAGVVYGPHDADADMEILRRDLEGKVPWYAAWSENWVGRFGLGSEVTTDAEVEASDFYRDWMEPQGLAPRCPIGHTIAFGDGRVIASVIIFRRGAADAFEPADLELLDLLVPHLSWAHEIHRRTHETAALTEALDRMPTGITMLDKRGLPVLTNHMAQTLFALNDGLSMSEKGPRAWKRDDDRVLAELIARASAEKGSASGVMAVTRPSGGRPFTVMVAPLLEVQAKSTLRDAVAMIYISDLQRGSAPRAEMLRTLYRLTEAEAELVDLLCEGLSLDEAATRRSVSIETARTQLKRVFVKTSTSRQSELVRLVLAGLPPAIE